MNKYFKNKIILITGGTGTIGSTIVEEIIKFQPKQIRVLSRDENKQYYLAQKLNYPQNLRLLIGDIRNKDRLEKALENVDIVFHTAAMKHVPLCEYNAFEAVETNIIGSQNVISAAIKNRVKKVIAISTDKASNPNNVMGTSKLMMEKLFINANYYAGNQPTTFACVRFGNVAWSNGSVLPLWKKQIHINKTIKVTNNQMTRFFMSRRQAADLIIKSAQISQYGEIFILKIPSIKLTDLAHIFLSKYYPGQNIKVENIDNRLGEKIHESLINTSEINNTILENEEIFIIINNLNIYQQISNIDFHIKTPSYENFKPANLNNIKKFTSSINCINIKKIKDII